MESLTTDKNGQRTKMESLTTDKKGIFDNGQKWTTDKKIDSAIQSQVGLE
jgi:hypothetical protein